MERRAQSCLSTNGSLPALTQLPLPISSESTGPQTCTQTTQSIYAPKFVSSLLIELATWNLEKATDATLPPLKGVGSAFGMISRLGFKIDLLKLCPSNQLTAGHFPKSSLSTGLVFPPISCTIPPAPCSWDRNLEKSNSMLDIRVLQSGMRNAFAASH